MEHGYGAEQNGGTVGGRLWEWHIEGQRHGDGSECDSVDTRQMSRGWEGKWRQGRGAWQQKGQGEGGTAISSTSLFDTGLYGVSTAILINVM